MKKKIYYFLLLQILFNLFSFTACSKTRMVDTKFYLNDDHVRLRKADSLDSDIVFILAKGTVGTILKIGKADIIDSEKGNWIQIRINDSLSGWVWGNYLSEISDETFERCKEISFNSFTDDDYLYFKNIGITRFSEIYKLFNSEQIEGITKLYIDFSQNIDYENISLFTKLDYLFIKNAERIDTSLIPQNISRLILKNCSISILDLRKLQHLEGISLYSCKKIDQLLYPNQVDFISLYDYPAWTEELDNFPITVRELYLCYDEITNYDFAKSLLKYPNLEVVYLEGNLIPEEEQIHQYGTFGFQYTDEY